LQFGVFRDLGPGAYLAVLGGLLGVVGSLMIVRWAAIGDRPSP